ncbi:MAG: BamA/TamA family outer membrane protein [Candidatus Zixiibacteriota bacterium]|nr:MAG: BamA/TamA family outer membrane protein [candidate division Zixibacteria bacterium]
MKSIFTYIVVAVILLASRAGASDTLLIGGLNGLDIYDDSESYSVSMALSGGGARGLSVIGLLKAFEEKSIKVCAIAGTSMGGIIGGLYASGYTPDELDSVVVGLSFGELFSNSPSRKTMLLTRRQDRDRHLLSVRFDGLRPVIPQALTEGQKLTSLITDLTTRANYQCGASFSRLPIPFKTISTDIVSGTEVVLDTGSLADAMRATMAFPLAFTGLESEDQVLMDGGMVTPIPVELVRKMCDTVDVVVAVNTASKLMPKEDLVTPVDIANQVTSIMTADQLARQLEFADYVIEPPIDDFVSSDFKYKDTLIQLGYLHGLTAADSIISLTERRRETDSMFISSIEVNSLRQPAATAIRHRLAGRKLSKRELISELKGLARELNVFQLEVHNSQTEPTGASPNGTSLRISGFENFRLSETWLRFSGNTVYESTILARELFTDDSLITPQSLRTGLEQIIALYESSDYDLVNISSVRIDPENRTIDIEIDEAVIERIDVEQNEHTKDWYIRSYFTLNTGQPYSTAAASRGVANIYGTDLFDRVTVRVLPSDSGAIVKIGVEEKKSYQFRLGWHWQDEYRSEQFIEFLDDNVGGVGLQYLLHARYAQERQNYYATFKTDRILNTYLTSRINLFHRRINRSIYLDDVEIGERKERKTGFDILFGQQIARFGAVSVGFTLQEIEYANTDTGVKRKFGLRIVKFESLVENFDRLPFPNTGNRHVLQLQLAGKYIGGDEEFTRFYASFETYFPIGRYVNYHPRIALGVSRSGLPPSEQFFLGGLHSFMGFRTHQLAGDKMFIFSNEIRVKLPLLLYLTFRHDMGEVYVSSDQIKLRNLRHGVGLALSLDSPIGPFEFGYGIVNSDIDQFYVNIGPRF